MNNREHIPEYVPFGIAILAIGWNMLPDKGPTGLLWVGGGVLMVLGTLIMFPSGRKWLASLSKW